jgi:tubulin polyglutamylase TTLL6/13
VCFEVLGFDIILDHKLKPWLLEVNHSPSFATDSPLDKKIKKDLMYDTFNLLNLSTKRKKKTKKIKADEFARRQKGEKNISKLERDYMRKKHMEERDIYDRENLGGYKITYPNDDYDL